jgi:diketogulonate reductase-like aldo/keto reductase
MGVERGGTCSGGALAKTERFGQSASAVWVSAASTGRRARPRRRGRSPALELGVDFWDTANVYGEGVSEALIGKFLKEDVDRGRIDSDGNFVVKKGSKARSTTSFGIPVNQLLTAFT